MIRVGLLGAGVGAQHLQAYRSLPALFEVTLIADRDMARAEDLRQTDTFKVVDSVEAALHNDDVDVIDICLPPHMHVPVTLGALEAGKHVICEKPLATSLDDVARVKETASDCGKSVFPVFQYRYGSQLHRLKHLIASGLTGRPYAAALETHWARGADYYAVPWRGTWQGEMGGAILGHAIHAHDLLTYILGPARTISAMTTTRVNPIETEDCAAITFQMESGAVATSNITLGGATDETRLRFVFEHVTATSGRNPYAPGTGQWTFVASDPENQSKIDIALAETPDRGVGFEGFLSDVASSLRGESHSAVSLEEGAQSIELVSAIYASAARGTRITLPLGKDDPIRGGWQP